MLVLFIYLAIGGVLLSALLIARNETIFTKDTRKTIREFSSNEGLRFVFAVLTNLTMIALWLPWLILAIVQAVLEERQ